MLCAAALACAPAGGAAPVATSPAALHARLMASSPADGDTLASAPAEGWLLFSEPVEPELCQVRLLSATGPPVELEIAGDPEDPRRLLVDLPDLARGGYRLRWRVASADGHPVVGDFVFHVAGEPPAAGPPPDLGPAPPAAEEPSGRTGTGPAGRFPLALLRGLALGALMALAGLLVFARGRGLGWAGGRVRKAGLTLAWAVPILLLAHASAWAWTVAPAASIADAALDALATLPGRLEAARLALALLALWALALARLPLVAAALAFGAVSVSAAIGHPAAISPALSVPLKIVHLAAAAAWLGGLLYLLLSDPGPEYAGRARRVSAVALAAILVLAATGPLQAVVFLDDWGALTSTGYGRLVLAKAAALLVLAGFGARHRRVYLPGLDTASGAAPFRRALLAEVFVMALVVGLSALLASVPVPEGGS